MPSSERPPRHDRGGLTRRRALAAGAAAVVAATTGCGLRLESGPAPAPTPEPPTVDELARERAAAQADRLLALVAAVRRTRPDIARELAQVAADHRAHAAALRPSPTTSTVLEPPLTAVPTLVAAERAAVSAVLADLAAESPSTARLLASVVAALQVHVDLLSAVSTSPVSTSPVPTRPPR